MSKTSKSEIEMLNAIKKQEERLKQMKSKFAKIKTAERAKTNANIIKALDRCFQHGIFKNVEQWEDLVDYFNDVCDTRSHPAHEDSPPRQ